VTKLIWSINLLIGIFLGGVVQFSPISARVVIENDTTAAQNDVSRRSLYSGAVVLAKGYPWRTFFPWMHQVAIPGGALAVVRFTQKGSFVQIR
jgi:hypothetical protein